MRPNHLRLASYRPDLRGRWNAFVRASKNGTFLSDRDYMEYHADRFADASLVAFEGDDESTVAALFPASHGGGRIVSHGGLTYGGWVTDARVTTPAMLRLFELLMVSVRDAGVASIRYKAIPRCYHRLSAAEDLYALFVQGAQLARQDVTSVIELASAPAWAKGRKHALSKARAEGVVADRTTDFADFRDCLAEALAAHGAEPVHIAAELEMLAGRFPEQIRLYAARRGDEALAYVLAFDCGQTVHTQYMVAREAGRRCGGLEAIIHKLQTQDYADRRYLSFGISTEQEGRILNHGLIAQKEMFGGRAMVCPFYDLAC